jgi:hypothetical protein
MYPDDNIDDNYKGPIKLLCLNNEYLSTPGEINNHFEGELSPRWGKHQFLKIGKIYLVDQYYSLETIGALKPYKPNIDPNVELYRIWFHESEQINYDDPITLVVPKNNFITLDEWRNNQLNKII